MAEVLLDPLADLRAPSPGWSCRWCRDTRGWVVLDLGEQPASDDFPLVTDAGPDPTYPLRMVMCAGCRLSQLEDGPRAVEEPAAVEPLALVEQGESAVGDLGAAGVLRAGATFAEFPSPHGGRWGDHLEAAGLRPAAPGEPADVVLDVFSLMHEPDLRSAVTARLARLAPDGVLVVQVHALAGDVAGGAWAVARHGHFVAFSATTLVRTLAAVGLDAFDAWEYPLQGGTTLVAFSRRGGSGRAKGRTLGRLLGREVSQRLDDPVVVATLDDAARDAARSLSSFVAAATGAGASVAGYAASSGVPALARLAGLTRRELVAIGDASPAKQGRALPSSRIPIVNPGQLQVLAPDYVLLFVPDLLDQVRRELPGIEESGGRWVVLDPAPHVVPTRAGAR